MDETELRDLLPAERPLPAAGRRDMEERLMEQASEGDRTAQRQYRVVAVAVAAVALVAGGVAAVVVGGSDPDPDSATTGRAADSSSLPTTSPAPAPTDPLAGVTLRPAPDPVEAARVQELADLHGQEENEGRPSLMAEMVPCVPAATPAMSLSSNARFASDFPLDEPLAAEAVIRACTAAGPGGEEASDPSQAQVCVVETPYPLAVVALDGLACEPLGSGLDLTVRPLTPDDLARINHMRAVEVSFLADPVDCRGYEEAQVWATEMRTAVGLDLPVVGDHWADYGTCFEATVSWHNYEQPGVSEGAAPPTIRPGSDPATVVLLARSYASGPDGPFPPRE